MRTLPTSDEADAILLEFGMIYSKHLGYSYYEGFDVVTGDRCAIDLQPYLARSSVFRVQEGKQYEFRYRDLDDREEYVRFREYHNHNVMNYGTHVMDDRQILLWLAYHLRSAVPKVYYLREFYTFRDVLEFYQQERLKWLSGEESKWNG